MNIKINYMVRRQTSYGWEILPRYINDFEIVYIIDGCGEIIIDDVKYKAKSGDLFFFRPKVKHSLRTSSSSPMQFYGLHFSPQPDDILNTIPPFIHIKEKHRTESLLKELYKEYRLSGYLSEWKKDIMLQQILCELLIKLHTVQNPTGLTRIQNVLNMIHQNPCAPYTMEDFLQQTGIKKTLFLQSFRKITGTTPVPYINNLRLEIACEMLLETNLPISEIGSKCGFPDAFYFSRCFKNRYLVSPKNYRESKIKYIP